MNSILRVLACAAALAAAPIALAPTVRAEAPMAGAQALQPGKPEDVGLSGQRLARIADALNREIKDGKIPGAVVMIARHGKLVYSEAFGFQDKNAEKPMSKDAVFRIYSMTKPLSAVGAMILVEEGRIQLADPVSKFLPEFKNLQVSAPSRDPLGQSTYAVTPAERQPTVHDLLRHTAGFAYGEITTNTLVKSAYARAGLFKPDFDYNTTDLTPEEFTQRLAQAPLAHQPGTAWEYSLAIDVLGRVVEKVSGQRLGRLPERARLPAAQDERYGLLGAGRQNGPAGAAARQGSGDRQPELAHRRLAGAEERLRRRRRGFDRKRLSALRPDAARWR
jgi:CubicO group peptidase (beta-lactamase class C family)